MIMNLLRNIRAAEKELQQKFKKLLTSLLIAPVAPDPVKIKTSFCQCYKTFFSVIHTSLLSPV
jgi:hypothetical protein